MKSFHACQHPVDPLYPRQCRICRNAGMRRYRATHVPSNGERLKANARAYAHVYLKRGKLQKKPCAVCGSSNSQMHHPDYLKPLEIVWLCRRHHLALHREAQCAAGRSVLAPVR